MEANILHASCSVRKSRRSKKQKILSMWTKKPWSTFFVMWQDNKKSAACVVQTADKTKLGTLTERRVLFFYTLNSCGFGTQILAEVAVCEFRVLRQGQIKAFDWIDFDLQILGGQTEDVTTLRFVTA